MKVEGLSIVRSRNQKLTVDRAVLEFDIPPSRYTIRLAIDKHIPAFVNNRCSGHSSLPWSANINGEHRGALRTNPVGRDDHVQYTWRYKGRQRCDRRTQRIEDLYPFSGRTGEIVFVLIWRKQRQDAISCGCG